MFASDPIFPRLALAWCCAWFAIGTLQSSFVLANDLRLGWGTNANGLALGAVGIGSALVQGLVVRRLVPRLGGRRTAMLGYSLAAIAYFLFGIAMQGWLVYAGIALQALGAVSGPAVQAMVSARAGPHRQGEMQGALASLQGLTAIISPLAGASLFSAFAPNGVPGAPFLLAVFTFTVAFISIYTLRREGAQPSATTPGPSV